MGGSPLLSAQEKTTEFRFSPIECFIRLKFKQYPVSWSKKVVTSVDFHQTTGLVVLSLAGTGCSLLPQLADVSIALVN